MAKSTNSKSKAKPTKLSHYDSAGKATMVDVSGKVETRREAEASAFVEMSSQVLAALPSNPKGNPLEVARFALLLPPPICSILSAAETTVQGCLGRYKR